MKQGKVLETEAEVREAVIRLLARREYSRRELESRLEKRVGDKGVLQAVLDDVIDKGYQSDQRMAEMFLRQRVSQGYGERRIRYDLNTKGVSEALVSEALAAAAVDWFEVAREHAVRRYGEGPPDDHKERAKRMRHLLGRGFGYDEVKYALDADES
ncbi:regulatory protein RecX [Marinobacterium litorale]|uniref:regulatory protein RecX n=1 Tax=Marinobacterium litorale TaxID=404770 RepID=UPI0004285E57|nr:regulatory protein RecX [Marinobacterium litorale]